MKKLQPREKLILAGTLGLAAFFIVYQLIIRPIRQGAMDIDERLQLKQEQLSKSRQLGAEKDRISARYDQLRQLMGQGGSDESQIPLIVGKIEAAAHDSNIHITDIQPQKSFSQKEARFLPIELQMDGQWLDIVRFLYMLQQRPDFYFIDEMDLEKKSDIPGVLQGRMVIARMSLS